MAEKIRKKRKKKKDSFYKDMTPALILPLVMAVHLYSVRAIYICLAGVVSAAVCDFIACRILKQKTTFKDMSTVYIGLLLSLMMPASAPLWLPVIASAFAVLLVKIPFGGASNSPFSPAAAAFAFLCICFPDEIFAYPVISGFDSSCVYGSESFIKGTSVTEFLSGSKSPCVTAVQLIDAFTGSVPGAIGMTSAVIMAGLLIYLLAKRKRSFINSISFLLVCLVGYTVITLTGSVNIFSENTLRVICMRLFSGFTLPAAVFLISEEGPSPKKTGGRILYGAGAAAIYLILSFVSVFEDAACFAVLFANALTPLFEKKALEKKMKEAED